MKDDDEFLANETQNTGFDNFSNTKSLKRNLKRY